MAEKSKKDKGINIYEMAGKMGKGVKKCGGYVLSAVVMIVISKGPDLFKKMKE